MPPVNPITPPLTPKDVETILQQITLAMLELPAAAYDKVRISWQIEGQPTGDPTQDIVYVRAVEDDDPINRQRDVVNNQNDAQSLQQLTTYIRVWRVVWVLMGPNGFDGARKIRSALYTQVPHDMFAELNVGLAAVLDPSAPRRVPEYIQGRWWERVDFECQFNELVTEQVITPAVASAEILLYNEKSPDIDHPVRDITVSTP